MCVCVSPVEDLEMNDGSANKPYFMSKGLMSLLGKKNDKSVDAKNDVPKEAKGKGKVSPEKSDVEGDVSGGKKGKWA